LEGVLNALASRKDVHHAVVGIASGDGSLLWKGAVGRAAPDGTPMTADTPYYIASVDKLFTASVVLKLCERGNIALDEPIVVHLPTSLIGGLHRLDGTDYTGQITVRHLLSHTSGLPDWLEDYPKQGPSLAERLIRDGDRSVSMEELCRIVRDQLVPHFPPQAATEPRQRVRYSDTNFMLLTAMIEAVANQPLHEVHQALLCRPLGLVHTSVAGQREPLAPTPEPATLWVGDRPMEIPLLMLSIRGIESTVDDTLKFLSSLFGGEVFAQPETLASMQHRWNRFGLPRDRGALRLPTWPIEYGLGIMRFHDPLLKLLGRVPRALAPVYPAPAVIGHTGSTGSWLFYCPDLDLFLSGTVDQVNAGALPFRLVPRILQAASGTRRPTD
jgi:CubicO group peptidase (beta-lactamase class C family)